MYKFLKSSQNCNNCDCSNKSCSCCKEEICGCKIEVDAMCVRYTDKDLPCLDVGEGERLSSILQKIDDKLCDDFSDDCTSTTDNVTYDGDDIENDGETIINEGDTLTTIVQNIYDQILIPSDIVCDTDTVVNAGDDVQTALNAIVAYFCGITATEDFNVAIPFPDDYPWVIAGTAGSGTGDLITQIDRNNCSANITVATVGAPAGTQFAWSDIGGSPQLTPTLTIDSSESVKPFELEMTVGAGVYNFDLVYTGCGQTRTVPVEITLI